MAKRLFIFLAWTILTTNSFAAPKSSTSLVIDTVNHVQLPRHFRLSLPNATPKINWQGFSDLHIAGGGQFSEEGLKLVLNAMNSSPISIIDLRQECHGFLNGNAISWYGVHNASNAGKTIPEIEALQAKLLNEVAKQNRVIVNKIIKKSPDELILEPDSYLVEAVESERELAARLGISYQRVYAQDHHAPSASDIDKFLAIIKNIPEDHWIFVHCRAGVGRSTTFMVIYDIFKNGKQLSFDDILARHVAIGGKDLKRLPDPSSNKFSLAKERLEVLQQFYDYVRFNHDNFATSWTDWSKRRN